MPHNRTDAALPGGPPSDDGRSHQRHPCDLPGQCKPVASWGQKDTAWTATITNLSLGGVRLRLKRRFEAGMGVAIDLGGGVVFAKVMNVQPAGEGLWELGCRFISEVGDDELLVLLQRPDAVTCQEHPSDAPISPSKQATEHRPLDLRRQPRHEPLTCAVLSLSIRPEFGGRRALLIDVSEGGAKVMLDRPLEPGDAMAIRLGGMNEEGQHRVAHVRHCRPGQAPPGAPWASAPSLLVRAWRWLVRSGPPPAGPAWVVGCQFTRPLTQPELAGLLALLRPAD